MKLPRGAIIVSKKVVCHLTTAHKSNDVRIYARECKSIILKTDYKLILVGYGEAPSDERIEFLGLGKMPENRLIRILLSQIMGLKITFRVDADVWHIHDPELLFVALQLIIRGKKVIWDAHEDYFLQFQNGSGHRSYLPSFMKALFFSMIRLLLNFVDKGAFAIIGATQTIAESYTNSNSIVVGNEARLEDFQDALPTFANLNVLFIGPISSQHCFQEVVSAIHRLEKINLVVGGNILKEDLHHLEAAKSLLQNRFSHLGWLNREELVTAISSSFVGLVTYAPLDTYSDINGKSTKLYEFLASGLPVVGTPVPSTAKIIMESKAGILAQGFTAKEIGDAIFELRSSPILWKEASLNAKIWARDVGSWEGSESNLLSVYKRALE